MKNFIVISLATLLASCAVGPNYRPPAVAPAVVGNSQSSALVAQSPEALWWQEFADPELDDPDAHSEPRLARLFDHLAHSRRGPAQAMEPAVAIRGRRAGRYVGFRLRLSLRALQGA